MCPRKLTYSPPLTIQHLYAPPLSLSFFHSLPLPSNLRGQRTPPKPSPCSTNLGRYDGHRRRLKRKERQRAVAVGCRWSNDITQCNYRCLYLIISYCCWSSFICLRPSMSFSVGFGEWAAIKKRCECVYGWLSFQKGKTPHSSLPRVC